LLDLALENELKIFDPGNSPETNREVLKKIRRGRRFAQRPDLAGAVMSDSEESGAGEANTLERALFSPLPGSSWKQSVSFAGEHMETNAPGAGRVSSAQSGRMNSSHSASDLTSGQNEKTFSLPTISTEESQLATMVKTPSSPAAIREMRTPVAERNLRAADEPPLRNWYSRRRLWNVSVSRDGLTARRHNKPIPGGAVVLGDGRIPLFTGRQLANPGYFYSVKITSIDDSHFSLGKCKDLAFAFGVSRLPANDFACEKPSYAYEIPGTVLVGYGEKIIDGGKWLQSDWDPKDLKVGDEVGVLVTMEGELVVYLNEEMVICVKSSLGEDASKRRKSKAGSKKRSLFPVIDLHGRVASVQLVPKKPPPNIPLSSARTPEAAPLILTEEPVYVPCTSVKMITR
jgi:hypothetical protein